MVPCVLTPSEPNNFSQRHNSILCAVGLTALGIAFFSSLEKSFGVGFRFIFEPTVTGKMLQFIFNVLVQYCTFNHLVAFESSRDKQKQSPGQQIQWFPFRG